jgi:hypothetical protein
MKTQTSAAILAASLLFAAGQANAAGCLKGAVVGGIAGHYAHHHAILGAIAGCAVGHHLAAEKAKPAQQQKANAAASQSAPHH